MALTGDEHTSALHALAALLPPPDGVAVQADDRSGATLLTDTSPARGTVQPAPDSHAA